MVENRHIHLFAQDLELINGGGPLQGHAARVGDDRVTRTGQFGVFDEVEVLLQEAYPAGEIIIHIDPVSVVADEPTPEYPAPDSAEKSSGLLDKLLP